MKEPLAADMQQFSSEALNRIWSYFQVWHTGIRIGLEPGTGREKNVQLPQLINGNFPEVNFAC